MATQIRMSAGPKRNWQPITIHPIVTDKYPATITSSIGALHDVAYYQGVLSNQNNYAKDGRLDVYEISDGQFIQQTLLDDAQCRSYLGVSAIHLGTKTISSHDCVGHQLHVSQQKGLFSSHVGSQAVTTTLQRTISVDCQSQLLLHRTATADKLRMSNRSEPVGSASNARGVASVAASRMRHARGA